MRIFLALLVSLLLPLGCGPSSGPEAYPTRPLTYIVPWSPGGGTDTVSRALAAVLQDTLGEAANVVNRTGGGGVVGHLALAQARPDGYTIGAITVELTMMHWVGLTDLTYADYVPLALLMNNPAAVTVRADAPWDTLGDLIAEIRANEGEHMASGTAKGGIWDLARIGLLDAAGLPESALPWVPSQGAAPALQELLAGGVSVVTAALAEADPLLQAGQVKVLAVMADERLPSHPDIPTLKEQGIDWTLSAWVGAAAPAGISDEVRQTLEAAVRSAANDPAYTEPLEKAGFTLQYMPADAFATFMARQDSTNGELLRLAGLAQTEAAP